MSRRPIAIRRMLPLSIVVDFDVVEKRLLSPGNILEFAVMNELGLYDLTPLIVPPCG